MSVSDRLKDLSKADLDDIARDCDINPKGMTKPEILKQLIPLFKEYEAEKARYTKIQQLGSKGKEGTVFLVKDSKNKTYAMKEFAKTKSSKNIEKEAILLKKASEFGLSPRMIAYDTVHNYIVMEKMEKSLFDHIKETKGKLSVKIQKEMINIFKKLDKIQIFHADPSPLNFMFDREGGLKIIDFGFAKPIDESLEKQHGTRDVNMKYMPLGFILKMSDFVDPSSFTELLKHVSEEDKKRIPLLNK